MTAGRDGVCPVSLRGRRRGKPRLYTNTPIAVCCDSLLHVFSGFLVSPELLRDRFQRRLKLHKDVLDRGVLVVTTPAPGLGICAGGFWIFCNIEAGPFIVRRNFVSNPHP